jgi:hypothetical protein
MLQINRKIGSSWYWFILGFVGIIVIYFGWYLLKVRLVGIRILYDPHDIGVYFKSSQWAIGEGILYRDVFSEYPLLANLIFGAIRYVSHVLHPLSVESQSFALVWVAVSWLLYLLTIYLVASKISVRSIWLWLTPAILYFALYKFDIYPSLTTLIALLSIRDEKYRWGAFWLGITIALKGYALFLIPAYALFLFYKKGIREAVISFILCVAPFILGNLIVLAYAGVDGVLAPYQFHAVRGNNGESTYDAISFLLFNKLEINPRLAQLLQVSSALLPLTLVPKTFDRLIDVFLIALLGFISFSTFYSPQYCLWITPLVCFSTSHKIRVLTILFSWLTFIYYPIGFDLKLKQWYGAIARTIFFKIPIIVITIIRFLIMYFSLKRLLTRQLPSSRTLQQS